MQPLDVLGMNGLPLVGVRTVGRRYLDIALGTVAKNFDDGANRTVFELYPLSLLIHVAPYLSR
jgi:hypothetical protein